jgi:RNA polymerase sigma-70 factor (ECF subfamily)
MLAQGHNEREERFLAMYENEADGLLRFVSYRTRERSEALDIVSESYLRTWRYLSEGNEVDNLRAFLYKTARNILIDEMRKRSIRKNESLDEQMETEGEPADMTELPAYDPMDIERAVRLLNDLEPAEFQEVLKLRYIEEWSLKEISEALEVSENVVSVRINRAMNKLRQQFSQ